MRHIKFFLFIIPTILLTLFFTNDMKKNNVLFCYGKLKPEEIKGYDYLILESKHYFPSNVRVMKSQNKKVLAYISLGEVNINANHYKELKNSTLGKNKIWNSFYLDLKSEKTIQILLNIVDETLKKGYDGLFLDNIDNYCMYGHQKAQKEDLIKLLKKIKEKYPNKTFIQNAGLEIIDQTHEYIDGIAIESIASNYTFKTKKYSLRDNSQFENSMKNLESIKNKYKMPIILIEYADTEVLYKQIEDKIKNSKFDYFIGNIDLQHLPKFKN